MGLFLSKIILLDQEILQNDIFLFECLMLEIIILQMDIGLDGVIFEVFLEVITLFSEPILAIQLLFQTLLLLVLMFLSLSQIQ